MAIAQNYAHVLTFTSRSPAHRHLSSSNPESHKPPMQGPPQALKSSHPSSYVRPLPMLDTSVPRGVTNPHPRGAWPQEHESYRLQIEKPDADSYYFGVYSDGFQVKDKDGDPQPVDLVQVDTKSKRLTVYHAMNGLDKAPNRLKMSDILKECWTWTGLQPQELTEVLGYQVANVQMRTAMAACRKTFGLQFSDSFSVTWAETDSSTQKMSCWNALMGTKFGSAIKSSIENFSIGKQLVSINVDNNGLAGKENWDHVYYGFT